MRFKFIFNYKIKPITKITIITNVIINYDNIKINVKKLPITATTMTKSLLLKSIMRTFLIVAGRY